MQAQQVSFYEAPVITLRVVRESGILVDRGKIRSPRDVATLLMERMRDYDAERMAVVCLDSRNTILSVQDVIVGTLNATIFRTADLFKAAILQNAAAVIIAHNHPSGDPTPSPEDVAVTYKLIEAGDLLDINVLDHVIIGAGRFVSLRERGLCQFKD